jgi:hypothetical protein
MQIMRLTCASAIAIALGVSALTIGTGTAAAQPGPGRCEFGNCQGPGGPGRPGGPGGPEQGPPPPPPPALGWRGIDQGRIDHQPFNYMGRWVTPVFNPDFNSWGFWLFGIWIPL